MGIGEEWEKSPEGAEGYACLEKLLAGKNYFIVTTAADGKIRESHLAADRIAEAGAAGEDGASSWDTYMKLLTLQQELRRVDENGKPVRLVSETCAVLFRTNPDSPAFEQGGLCYYAQ